MVMKRYFPTEVTLKLNQKQVRAGVEELWVRVTRAQLKLSNGRPVVGVADALTWFLEASFSHPEHQEALREAEEKIAAHERTIAERLAAEQAAEEEKAKAAALELERALADDEQAKKVGLAKARLLELLSLESHGDAQKSELEELSKLYPELVDELQAETEDEDGEMCHTGEHRLDECPGDHGK